MNLFKFSLLGLFVFLSFVIPGHSFAVVTAPSTKSVVTDIEVNKASVVANVNIDSAKIVSQVKNDFNITFNISNKEGLQTGVKYGVQLIKDGAKYISDEKVYDESVTLYENSTIKRDITYTAPSNLSGNYVLVLSAKNENNFPFGVISLGKVKLVASTKGVSILNDSCYLQVEGEKSGTHYSISQSVDISTSESLKLTCNILNESNSAMSVTPSFETRYFSAYGKIAPQTGGDASAISLKKGEKKTVTIALPKSDKPQFYTVKVSLVNGVNSSNAISIPYIIRGINGSLQKISLDKDYYKGGESGKMTVLWSASAGNFARSGISGSGANLPKVSLNTNIKSDNGKECISSISQPLIRDPKNPQTIIPFTTVSNCLNPIVSANITDENGNILDQKDFSFKSNPVNSTTNDAPSSNSRTIILIILALLIIVGIGMYMKKNRNPDVNV